MKPAAAPRVFARVTIDLDTLTEQLRAGEVALVVARSMASGFWIIEVPANQAAALPARRLAAHQNRLEFLRAVDALALEGLS